jgi:hypothetical protein
MKGNGLIIHQAAGLADVDADSKRAKQNDPSQADQGSIRPLNLAEILPDGSCDLHNPYIRRFRTNLIMWSSINQLTEEAITLSI